VSPSVGAKKPFLRFFGLRHLVVSPIGSSLRRLDTSAQLQTFLPLSNGIKIVSVLQRLHGEIRRTISGVQKRDEQTDRQTDGETKTQRFWPPRRRVKSEPYQTWHDDRRPPAHSCPSETFGDLTHSKSFAAGAENLGITRPRQLKTPHDSITL